MGLHRLQREPALAQELDALLTLQSFLERFPAGCELVIGRRCIRLALALVPLRLLRLLMGILIKSLGLYLTGFSTLFVEGFEPLSHQSNLIANDCYNAGVFKACNVAVPALRMRRFAPHKVAGAPDTYRLRYIFEGCATANFLQIVDNAVTPRTDAPLGGTPVRASPRTNLTGALN